MDIPHQIHIRSVYAPTRTSSLGPVSSLSTSTFTVLPSPSLSSPTCSYPVALDRLIFHCRCSFRATKIFSEMPEKDVFSWSIMISGFALHGKESRSFELFYDIMESGLTPNNITFVLVPSSYSHTGLVTEGKSLFNRLIQTCGLKPKIEHYGCMVDLLSRAGLLDEAKELIEGMPIKPDAVMWRSLLSACLGHGNLKSWRRWRERRFLNWNPMTMGCIYFCGIYTTLEIGGKMQ